MINEESNEDKKDAAGFMRKWNY
ncbi:hypothetical protein PCHDK_000536700, partial [Plasmodium chabaudi adami]